MERAIQPIFDTVNINFIGKNYAMGGTSSGPEITYCASELFGQDIKIKVNGKENESQARFSSSRNLSQDNTLC